MSDCRLVGCVLDILDFFPLAALFLRHTWLEMNTISYKFQQAHSILRKATQPRNPSNHSITWNEGIPIFLTLDEFSKNDESTAQDLPNQFRSSSEKPILVSGFGSAGLHDQHHKSRSRRRPNNSSFLSLSRRNQCHSTGQPPLSQTSSRKGLANWNLNAMANNRPPQDRDCSPKCWW